MVLGQAGLESSPNISFDRAVLEVTSEVTVVPLDCGWKDVGSWSALWELAKANGGVLAFRDVELSGKGEVEVGLTDAVLIVMDNGAELRERLPR